MPTVKVNDIHMYYELYGEGEVLVLIAGLGTDLSEYDGIISWLAQKYQVLAFDNRGAGRTDKPDIPYSIEMMANDTAGLMQTLGVRHTLAQEMHGGIQGSEMITFEGGHLFSLMKERQQFLDAIAKFLE